MVAAAETDGSPWDVAVRVTSPWSRSAAPAGTVTRTHTSAVSPDASAMVVTADEQVPSSSVVVQPVVPVVDRL